MIEEGRPIGYKSARRENLWAKDTHLAVSAYRWYQYYEIG